MTKTKHFAAFGVDYRAVQFPAVPSLAMMSSLEELTPMELLSRTEVNDKEGGGWVRLDDRNAINSYVKDALNILPPMLVLRGLISVVNEHSFAFAKEWRGVKIPSRFRAEGEVKSSAYVAPMIASILQEKMATLRELEEYYSLEDAFKMFDVIVAKGVNTALAHESASVAAKRR